MELNTKERIVIGMLVREGNFTTLKIVHKLRDDLSFTEEESKKLKFVALPGGKTAWDDAEDVPREFNIGEIATSLIVEELKKLNSARKLTEDHFSLYEKFVEKE